MRVRVLSALACGVVFGCGPKYGETAYASSESQGAEESAAAATLPPATPAAGQAGRPVDPWEGRGEGNTRREPAAVPPSAGATSLNGHPLSAPDLRELEARFGVAPERGDYWYDARSGFFGLIGHGAGGITSPGLRAAALEREVSAGNTGVLINERELTASELRALAALLNWNQPESGSYAGRYVLKANGELYGPANRYLGNLAKAAEKKRANESAATLGSACVWLRFGTAPGTLARAVTVGCD